MHTQADSSAAELLAQGWLLLVRCGCLAPIPVSLSLHQGRYLSALATQPRGPRHRVDLALEGGRPGDALCFNLLLCCPFAFAKKATPLTTLESDRFYVTLESGAILAESLDSYS